jgi:soluble cytochrome b562
MIRLTKPTGIVLAQSQTPPSASGQLVRKAILVHVGDFQSADGPIVFDEARLLRVVENQNAKIKALAADYGGLDKMPLGAFPPILDQHDDDSVQRVGGRMGALLEVASRDIPGVGKNVPCIMTDLTFLGDDTICRVLDGRIYALSVGIDESTDTFDEISTVITPAAPGAMLLAKKKKAAAKAKTKTSSRLAAQTAQRKRMAILTSLQKDITTLSTTIGVASAKVRMISHEGDVRGRLIHLMRGGKLTPAEYRSMDLTRLSRLDGEGLSIVMDAFNTRQNVIEPGQRGSSAALEFSEIGKNMAKTEVKKLRKEFADDYKRLTGKKLESAEADMESELESELEEAAGKKRAAAEAPVEGDEKGDVEKKMDELKKHLDGGDMEAAKKALSELEDLKKGKKHMAADPSPAPAADVKSEDYRKGMSELQKQIDELSTQLARVTGQLTKLVEVEGDEAEHEAAPAGDPAKAEADMAAKKAAEAAEAAAKK